VGQEALDDATRALQPDLEAIVCARVLTGSHPQIKATIELARDVPQETARQIAIDKATALGAALRRHGFALPAYVEIISPGQWHGVAFYDRDSLGITWDACPGNCEKEGTRNVRRCRP
jgi:hypothetical protein